MEIIGFIAALLFGGYLCFAGYGMIYVYVGFTGKFNYYGAGLFAIGCIVLYLTFKYAPFTVSINTP